MQSIEPVEIYRDHFEECLRHFGKRFHEKVPKKKGSGVDMETLRKPMVDFCNVGDQSVYHWLTERHLPKGGDALIKASCYMWLHGYKVIEFESLPKNLKPIWEVIGFGLMSGDEVRKTIGFGNLSELLRIFRGKYEMAPKKQEKAWDLILEMKDKLLVKKKESFSSGRLEFLFQKTSGPEQLELLVSAFASSPSPARGLSGIMHIVQGLLYLFEENPPNIFSVRNIQTLTEKDGAVMRKLSSALTDLSLQICQAEKG